MKSVKAFSDSTHREINIDVDALLAAINENSENKVQPVGGAVPPSQVSISGHDDHTYAELAEAFELDIHDFWVSELNH